jgi:ABC-type amino acid transport substrate-binding protein/mono/diheme cytochrome c family protein
VFAALLALLCGISQRAGADQTPGALRLCADPTNLPFSSDRPEAPGLYLEVGAVLGRATGRAVTNVWNLTYFGKRALRTTLLAGRCDASIGLPEDADFMGPRIIFTRPLLDVGYALVTPRSVTVTRLDDLDGRRVAVQFGSTPQSLLAERDAIETVTFREPEEAVRALAAGKVDAAFVWGPTAGYLNKSELHDALNVVPVAGPGLTWSAAIGLVREQTALRDELDHAIDANGPLIDALAAKYGFPGSSATLAVNTGTLRATHAAAAADQTQGGPAAAPSEARKSSAHADSQPVAANTEDLAEGREIFNGTCGHCHGPDAVQAERRINLRLLRHRYGEEMDEKYRYTVTHGRPEKGMPNWREVLTDEQLDKILAFLHSVQTD